MGPPLPLDDPASYAELAVYPPMTNTIEGVSPGRGEIVALQVGPAAVRQVVVKRDDDILTPAQLKERNALLGRGKKDKVVRREVCAVKTPGTRMYGHMDKLPDVNAVRPTVCAYAFEARDTHTHTPGPGVPGGVNGGGPCVKYGSRRGWWWWW